MRLSQPPWCQTFLICLFVVFFVCFFLGPHPRHVEVPRLELRYCQLLLWGSYNLGTGTQQGQFEKGKWHTNLAHEHRCKNPNPKFGTPSLATCGRTYKFFFFFLWHMEVPRLGVELELPTPQPQQFRIWAVSATCTTTHSNTGSPTHWARPGIEPSSSWILVRFIPDMPQ